MSTVTTLRPNSSTVLVGSVNIQGGAPSRESAVSDDNDATYVLHLMDAATVQYDLTTFGMPGGAQVRNVRARARIAPSGSGGCHVVASLTLNKVGFWPGTSEMKSIFFIPTPKYGMPSTILQK